ncbi:uncharacterized protein BDZ99DRAFT_390796 [Mytilinidion resinicola]|uniref:Protein with SprT-like domain at the N terminus n=1 Tax=Mytilinidion resinicola TaxID=574789 RepID=A0A6A6YIU3_9PEZI|nr:uncharacterized protein BDZ99DRAFT_390796 [Mytilinidion resinicola]KAF2808468.1 hypothetical protein BDZ99DRAFT_390796 [Mytilinidion resinicola]
MPLTDEDAALLAISTFCEPPLSQDQEAAKTSIQSILHGEGADPFVDIHELFGLYNILYFRSLLLPQVEVLWSPRLTLCAGICELTKDNEGKYRRIRLKLSEPLLKFRPREDTVDTLLHEAIHAYFFITTSWHHSRGDDGTGHGLGFQLLADSINSHGSYAITVYHTFHDEVDSYRTHVWQCDGPCRQTPPYFGLVKRSMNRAPGKSDTWWDKHQNDCGGTYVKIAEPEPTKQQLKNLSLKARAGRQKNKLDSWVAPTAKSASGVEKACVIQSPSIPSAKSIKEGRNLTLGDHGGLKRRLDLFSETSSVTQYVDRESALLEDHPSAVKRPRHDIDERSTQVECPICGLTVAEENINEHLDELHSS